MPRFLKDFFTRNGVGIGSLMLGLVLFWTIGLIILPQLSMLDFSFRPNLPPPEVGGPKDVYTLENYKYLVFGPEGGGQAIETLHGGVWDRQAPLHPGRHGALALEDRLEELLLALGGHATGRDQAPHQGPDRLPLVPGVQTQEDVVGLEDLLQLHRSSAGTIPPVRAGRNLARYEAHTKVAGSVQEPGRRPSVERPPRAPQVRGKRHPGL
mgnify:CR=1 FL=1